MATNGRKRYFHIDKNASSEQIYALLDDVETADEDDFTQYQVTISQRRKKRTKKKNYESGPKK